MLRDIQPVGDMVGKRLYVTPQVAPKARQADSVTGTYGPLGPVLQAAERLPGACLAGRSKAARGLSRMGQKSRPGPVHGPSGVNSGSTRGPF